jgi:hypothetical protein
MFLNLVLYKLGNGRVQHILEYGLQRYKSVVKPARQFGHAMQISLEIDCFHGL